MRYIPFTYMNGNTSGTPTPNYCTISGTTAYQKTSLIVFYTGVTNIAGSSYGLTLLENNLTDSTNLITINTGWGYNNDPYTYYNFIDISDIVRDTKAFTLQTSRGLYVSSFPPYVTHHISGTYEIYINGVLFNTTVYYSSQPPRGGVTNTRNEPLTINKGDTIEIHWRDTI